MKKERKDTLIEKFEEAFQRLEEAIKERPTQMNKDATIQRFEFTFELSWKAAQAFLKDQGIVCKSPRDCFRKSADYGLIKSPTPWFDFLKARNNIAHTYNQKMADRIYKKAIKFPNFAEKLLKNLKE
ncbi:MAG: HI0074 family nucleotidyltransferase substrate-binding subunit [Patescibacteria group bacterium]